MNTKGVGGTLVIADEHPAALLSAKLEGSKVNEKAEGDAAVELEGPSESGAPPCLVAGRFARLPAPLPPLPTPCRASAVAREAGSVAEAEAPL